MKEYEPDDLRIYWLMNNGSCKDSGQDQIARAHWLNERLSDGFRLVRVGKEPNSVALVWGGTGHDIKNVLRQDALTDEQVKQYQIGQHLT